MRRTCAQTSKQILIQNYISYLPCFGGADDLHFTVCQRPFVSPHRQYLGALPVAKGFPGGGNENSPRSMAEATHSLAVGGFGESVRSWRS